VGTLIDTSLLVAAERRTFDLEGFLASLPEETLVSLGCFSFRNAPWSFAQHLTGVVRS
jgi:hypothetical protein